MSKTFSIFFIVCFIFFNLFHSSFCICHNCEFLFLRICFHSLYQFLFYSNPTPKYFLSFLSFFIFPVSVIFLFFPFIYIFFPSNHLSLNYSFIISFLPSVMHFFYIFIFLHYFIYSFFILFLLFIFLNLLFTYSFFIYYFTSCFFHVFFLSNIFNSCYLYEFLSFIYSFYSLIHEFSFFNLSVHFLSYCFPSFIFVLLHFLAFSISSPPPSFSVFLFASYFLVFSNFPAFLLVSLAFCHILLFLKQFRSVNVTIA